MAAKWLSRYFRVPLTVRLFALDRRNKVLRTFAYAHVHSFGEEGRTAGSEYTFIYTPAVLFMELIVIVK